MKKKTRSRLLDSLIVAICLGVCSASIYLFWKDLNSSSDRKDKEQIATIEFKQKIAQRKYSDRVVWERLQDNSPLYDADTLRTADGAYARVTFTDGTVLDLYENTMLQVNYSKENGLMIAVNDGNIDIDTTDSKETQSVALSMDNGSVFKLDSGSKLTATSNSSSGDNSFKLQSGNATVTTKTSDGKVEAQTITSGETVKVDSTGDVKKDAVTVTSISSETKIYAFNGEKTMNVKLVWNTSKDYENKEIQVETSLVKDFSKIKDKFTVTNKNNYSLKADLGKTYWRVYPKGETSMAAAGRIVVEEVPPVTTVSPVTSSIFSYRNESELPKIQFAWNGNDYADHYLLEVSKLQDMSNPIINQEVTDTQVSVRTLEKGNYYWRVTPYYKVNSTGWGKPTSTSSFTIEQVEQLAPPKLTLPANKGKLTFTAEKETGVTFQWKSDVKQADYKLQVAQDKNFSKVIYDKELKSTRITENFTLETLPAGTYYWKVTRSSVEDEKPVNSAIHTFTVEKYVPGENKLIYPPADYSVEKSRAADTNFIWKLSSDYDGKTVTSVLQFSPSSKFDREVTEVKTETTEAKDIQLKGGTYYWRVGIVTSGGTTENFTNPRIIKVLEQLGRPTITEPVPGSTMVVSGTQNITFKWTAVEGADYYKVKVYETGSDKLKAEISSTKQNSGILQLSAGNYRCTVQAFAEETDLSQRRTSKATEMSFTLRNPLPVTLMSPANGTKIPGLTAIRTETVLTWKQGDKVAKSQLVLKKLQANGNYKVVQTINNPKTQVRLERLTPGTYQWTITASSENGVSLDSQSPATFIIQDIPDLAAAKLLKPVNGDLIGSDYLRNNRNIAFDWANVEGATDYTFVLYQKNKNGLKKIYEERNIKTSEIKIKDLSILDIGDFEWNVTAYSHARDGYQEQKGKTATGNFKIDFALPGKVQTMDPGKLYGE